MSVVFTWDGTESGASRVSVGQTSDSKSAGKKAGKGTRKKGATTTETTLESGTDGNSPPRSSQPIST